MMKCFDIKFYLPSKNFDESLEFYKALGFSINWTRGDVAEVELEGFRFLLQDFYIKEHANNFVVHMLVDDALSWYKKFKGSSAFENAAKASIQEPKEQPWGIVTAFMTDPAGVLWHIAEKT